MRTWTKMLSLALTLCLALGLVPALAEDAAPYYTTLDPQASGEIDIMVWSGDSIYYEDLGSKDWKPEDITKQNVASVYAMAKAFKLLYPNIKINLWAKLDDPNGNGISWYQEMENFKAEHGKYPDVYASTDLAGDLSRGLVSDLSVFADDPLYKSFNSAIMGTMNYYGFQAGLPQFMQPWGVWVNKELAENNNIDMPDPDWDLDAYTAVAAAGDNKTFWGALNPPLSFINTGTKSLNYSLYHYDGEGAHLDLNSGEVAALLDYVPQWAASAVFSQQSLGNVPDEIMNDGWWWGYRFFCRNYALTYDGDPWMMGAATGGKDAEGNWIVNAVESADWDIYPRPATPYQENTIGIVIDPMAIHNYAMDDNNPEWSDKELQQLKLAYAFGSFWCGATESMQARADQLYADNNNLRTALNDSFPLVTGEAFKTQMDIWYSTESHKRYGDADAMPGFQYVMELWEKGQMWDISDKTYPYYIYEDGNQIVNLLEWNGATNPDIAGAHPTDPNWVDNVKAKLGDWNEKINARFDTSENALKEGLIKYYGYTEESLTK